MFWKILQSSLNLLWKIQIYNIFYKFSFIFPEVAKFLNVSEITLNFNENILLFPKFSFILLKLY